MDEIDLYFSDLLFVFAIAFAVAFFTTPVSMWIARKIGAIDVPRDSRRMHQRILPRFGGMAIFLGTVVATLIREGENEQIRIALLGGVLMYALGVWDDLKDLKPWVKFSCQTAIAILMFALGLRITFITNYFAGGHWNFGIVMCFLVTVFWIVGITNTINLIDGLDGLAAGISAIAALSMAYVAYIRGSIGGMTTVCIALMALAGACSGFLPYNFSPAKTIMGDGGALFLGYMIAIMAVISPLRRSTVIAAVVPVMALAIPIFDTSFAIIRRMVNHQGIMTADKEHLHHRLMESGYGQRRAVLMLYGISAIMGVASILVSRDLVKEAVVLSLIAVVYLYVFLTDPNHKTMSAKGRQAEAQRKAAEAAKAAKSAERDRAIREAIAQVASRTTRQESAAAAIKSDMPAETESPEALGAAGDAPESTPGTASEVAAIEADAPEPTGAVNKESEERTTE